MAKAGDKPKGWEKEEVVVNKTYIDPDPDPLGFEKGKTKLVSLGFNAYVDKGVLMVHKNNYNEVEFKETVLNVEKALKDVGYKNSWGVSVKNYLTND
jgi:hypothetical protein